MNVAMSVLLGVITATGVWVTAWFAWLHYRRTTLYSLPTPTVLRGPLWIKVELSATHGGPEWRVTGVGVQGRWFRRFSRPCRYLALPSDDGTAPDPHGHPRTVGFAGPWHRRIAYDPPVRQSELFIHPGCSRLLALVQHLLELAVERHEPPASSDTRELNERAGRRRSSEARSQSRPSLPRPRQHPRPLLLGSLLGRFEKIEGGGGIGLEVRGCRAATVEDVVHQGRIDPEVIG